jgi:hypothetical protein
MNEWTILEVHSLGEKFTENQISRYHEMVEQSSEFVLDSNEHRIVGKSGTQSQYPDNCRIKSMTDEDDIAIVLCSAKDVLSSTLLFVDGKCTCRFKNDYHAQKATYELIREHNINPYIQEEWDRIECEVSIFSNKGLNSELDGHLTTSESKNYDAQMKISAENENEIVAKLDESEIRQIIRKLKSELGGYEAHKSIN